MDDVLSDILRLIRLKSCVYFVRDFWSPWGMRMDGGAAAQFHVVLRGHCVIEAAGQTLQGAPGDVFLLPRGEGHVLADAPGRTAVPGQDFMRTLQDGKPLFSQGEAPAQIICGHYEYNNDLRHALIDELPALIHIRSFDSFSPESLASVLPALIKELKSESPGADLVVEKLAEVLLVQVLRAHFIQEQSSHGFLAALFDGRLRHAFRLIHGDFDRQLTLDELAEAAGMSRSAFAFHFKSVLGLAPIAYLTKWRMCRANDLLRGGGLTLSQVAFRVGYESEISFGRAFKRHFGSSPGAVRRRRFA